MSLPSGGGRMGVLGGSGVRLPHAPLGGLLLGRRSWSSSRALQVGEGEDDPPLGLAGPGSSGGVGVGGHSQGEGCTAQARGGVGLDPPGGGARSQPALLPPSAGRREFLGDFGGGKEGSSKAQPRGRCCAGAVAFVRKSRGSPSSTLRRVDLGREVFSGLKVPPVPSWAGGRAPGQGKK